MTKSISQVKLCLLVGLPRSGTHLVNAILGQRPDVSVSASSPLPGLVTAVRDSWTMIPSARGAGLNVIRPRVEGAIRGMVSGYHGGDERLVIDMSRQWLGLIDLMVPMMGAHVILVVRDVLSIVASFERIHRLDPLGRSPWNPAVASLALTPEGRAKILLAPDGVVGAPIQGIRGMPSGVPLTLVRYGELCRDPQRIMSYVDHSLGLPQFKYDFSRIEGPRETASVHGWGESLHEVRSSISPRRSVHGVYSRMFREWVKREYADIEAMARVSGDVPGYAGEA